VVTSSQVLRGASSAFLAVFLLAGMLWGRCANCPPTAPEKAGQPDCCQRHHSDDCQAPTPKQTGTTCPNLALVPVPHQAIDLDIAQLVAPAPAHAVEVVPEPAAAAFAPAAEGTAIHAPPDLYLLNSTLLV
jgi:hypothetical protein